MPFAQGALPTIAAAGVDRNPPLVIALWARVNTEHLVRHRLIGVQRAKHHPDFRSVFRADWSIVGTHRELFMVGDAGQIL